MSENGQPDITMAERMAKLTEIKQPSANGTIHKAAEQVKEKINKTISDAWNYSDDDFVKTENFDTLNKEAKEEIKEQRKQNEQQPEQTKQKFTDQDYQDSGETMTGLLDLFMTGGFSIWERHKLKKAFTKEEWKRLKEVQRADKTTLSDADKLLRNRIEHNLKQFKERREEIEMDENEIRKTERGFKNYYKTADKKVSPEVMFIATIATAVLGRLGDSYFEDEYI